MPQQFYSGDLPGQPGASSASIGVMFQGMPAAAHGTGAQRLCPAVTLPLDDLDDSGDGENAVGQDMDNADRGWSYAGSPLVRSPFCLLVDPQAAQLAARHAATLPLPRRAVYLFSRRETESAADDQDVVDHEEDDEISSD